MQPQPVGSEPTAPSAERSFDAFPILFSQNPLPMWVYDLSTRRFLDVNDAAVARYGYSREEFLQMRVPDLLPPGSVAQAYSAPNRLSEAPHAGEWRHLLRDGSIIVVEMHSHPLTFQGTPAALVIVHDVTNRRIAEDAVRKSERAYREMIENANDLVYSHDLSGNLLFANEAAERLTGYTVAELQKLNITSLLVPDDVERARTMIARKVRGARDATTYELSIVAKDGTVIPLEVSTRVLKQDGGPVAIQGVGRDITARKRVEDIVSRQTARAETIAEVSRSLAVANTELSVVLDRVGLAASDLIGDACVIRLVTDDGERLEAVAIHHKEFEAVGLLREVEDNPYRTDEGLFARLVATNGAIRLGRLTLDDVPEAKRESVQHYIERFGIDSVLAAPLLVKGTTIGSITLARDIGGRPYTAEDEKFLTELADRAAIAIANARLLAETQERLRQVQALRRIDTAIIGTMDVGMTLDVIVAQIRSELQVDAAQILLLDGRTQRMTLATASGFDQSHRVASIRLGEGLAGRSAFQRETIIVPDVRAGNTGLRAEAVADGYAGYAVVPLIARAQVKGVIEVFSRARLLPAPGWQHFFEALSAQTAIAIDNAHLLADLQRANIAQSLAYETTLEGWSRALDLRDHEIEGHSVRVAHMTYRLAAELGLPEDELINIRRGALLHDIGKMGIPDSILQKAGKLSDEEWVIMRKHPEYAYELLSPIDYLRPAIDVPFYHHERYDGSGYPKGLRGEQIPQAARIFAVVDVWDALRSDRPYRAAMAEDDVRAYIDSSMGTLFDPHVAATFLRMEW